MSILLPDPQYLEATFTPLDFGGLLTPSLGGPVQRVNRLGNRLAVQYTLKPMYSPDEGRVFVMRLMRGRQEGVIAALPQSGVPVLAPGSPLVSSSVAAGATTLPLKTVGGGYPLREGQPLSIIHAGRRYVHWVTADIVTGGAGFVLPVVYPPIRTSLSTNDVVEIAKPYIEGYLSGDSDSWSKAAHARNAIQFTVTEAA